MEDKMEIVYSNFDGLDLSFQCVVPERILARFRHAKEQAQKEKQDCALRLDGHNKPVMVAETGSRGGYAFRFDTGIDGETWFLVDTRKPDVWNVRVSIKSLTLALNGYNKSCKKVLYFLQEILHGKGKEKIDELTGEITYPPLERISRFDYCIDYKTDEFVLIPRNFIVHSRCKKTLIGEENNLAPYSIMYGEKYSYFRAGTMPYKQVVLYDKLKDIKTKSKKYWFKFWNIDENEFSNEIWRLEIRAGKKELNNWNLRRFEDFENKVGDVILQVLQDIRYSTPSDTDTNITRWQNHEMWKLAIQRSELCLDEYISNAKRGEVMKQIKEEVVERFNKQFIGLFTSYTAILDEDMAQIPAVIERIKEHASEQVLANPRKTEKKYLNAKNKYDFQ